MRPRASLRGLGAAAGSSGRVAPFWIGEIEVTWDEFDAFYAARGTGRKTTGESVAAVVDKVVVDAVTGPTPPYGSPDQSWGKGLRPVITMTHHAAEVYCAWLSKITGDEYRLPTEAEWEYACRGGADGPYWFEADPKAVSERSLWNRWFGAEDTVHPYAWYDRNSGSRTQPPYALQPNPLGLYAMLGNVWELTATPYSPEGPGTGGASIESTGGVIEYAIRGGSYRSDPADLRSAEREPTRHDRWLLTDPQLPKSIWWYSDTREVGFRIVRTYRGD